MTPGLPLRMAIGPQWAGPLPSDWRVGTIRRFARVFAGGTPDKSIERYWQNGTVPWLASGEVNQWLITEPTTYITEEALRNSSARWVSRNALVVALAGQGRTKGMAAQMGIDATCNQSLAAIVPDDRIHPRFLLWWLAAHYETLRNLAGGELRDGLNLDIISSVPVPLPSLATQRSVADYLDRETTRIDALIAAKRRLVALLAERFAEARNQAVRGAGPQGSRQQGPAWLADVPAHWSIKRLKFISRMDSGHTPDRKIPEYWVDCTIPWVTLNDVGELDHSWELTEVTNAINELGMANSSAHPIPAGSVILSRDATVGRAAILARPMAVSQHFVSWTCGGDLEPEYLLQVIRGPMQQHFGTLTAGATIATIGMPELRELVIPVPPLDEQRQIVKRIRHLQRSYDEITNRVTVQVGLLQERRQALITAAVIGELEIPEVAA